MTPFVKMNGQGNDFIIVDAHNSSEPFPSKRVALLSHRRFGLGCDQFVVLHCSTSADIRMQIFNADGREVSACGNATRCVAFLINQRTGKRDISIETKAGMVQASVVDQSNVSIILPEATITPESVPLTRRLVADDFALASLHDPLGVNVGNPHIVYFPDARAALPKLEDFGAFLNAHHPLVPEGANIEWVTVQNRHHIGVQVYERGVGMTMSCGTGACAAVVAGHHWGILEAKCRVSLEGGDLNIEILTDKRLVLSGPVCYVCEGQMFL